MLDSVDLPILNAKDWDFWESPVARYLRVTMSLSAGAIGFLDRHGFFSMKGSTSASKCWKRSRDILENLSLKTSRHCLIILVSSYNTKISKFQNSNLK